MTFVYRSAAHSALSDHAMLPYMADVEFGVLNKNGDCINIGICKVNTNIRFSSAPRRCRHALAQLIVTRSGTLQMRFDRKDLLPCTERAIFKLSVFPVPVAFTIPDAIREALPELSQTVIAPGRYPILSIKEAYLIEF